MGGPSDPPDGVPEGAPGGGEDEYRSVVFDESFVRAARLQEYSAQERIGDHTPAVRRRPPLRHGLPRQALILVLLVALAFGTAVYMGLRNPSSGTVAEQPAEPLRMTVVPLAPQGPVPGAPDAEQLYANSPAAQFRVGAEGVPLPAASDTEHFSDEQVTNALTTARNYIVRSALDRDVLRGDAVRSVRVLLDPDQLEQFDASFDRPASDGRHAPTGWLVRFDGTRAEITDDDIRVRGSLRATENDSATLQVVADHTVVYPLRPAGDDRGEVSLFTVRRELHFHFDQENLRLHQARLVLSYVQAGPLSCTEDSASQLRPLLAGQTAGDGAPAGTDPYSTDSATGLCGTLASNAQPTS
ncbi:SCO2583 family membrane protein [Streptomyces poriticola]|uniref:SCO2583 family membrane protein n=1 Tax=Streptomyces poriticola TaxID=3120506 RepID=UPI002FCE4EE8